MSDELVDMTDSGNLLNAEDSMDSEEESLERICLSTRLDNRPTVDAKVIDSATTVQMLTPKVAKTFQDNADNVFIPYILNQLETISRTDIVWDLFLPVSRMREEGHWSMAESSPQNRQSQDIGRELFQMLATNLETLRTEGKQIVSTCSSSFLSSPKMADDNCLHPWKHDEADTRIMFHVKHRTCFFRSAKGDDKNNRHGGCRTR